ncbi:MAG: hypothetical protein L6455_06575 [Kiritimatiellae bacterium]|nr:hypothetical protein [Verrucomicrobiota bacterium]MBU4290012.1 hypothetical protein [Verrucomicrobiota bacterium]MCG2679617.1 hypothetical protein [Kiritimatiellia bacterium]
MKLNHGKRYRGIKAKLAVKVYELAEAIAFIKDKPAAGDFDGDGKADPGMVDANGNWYVWLSASGYSQSCL